MSGCDHGESEMNRMLHLRKTLLSMECCNFETQICADFGEMTYTFLTECTAERNGTVHFVVKEPKSIQDISGTISSNGGKTTYLDTALAFPLLADGEVSPAAAPYLLIRSLMGGYLSGTVQEDKFLHATIHDSYEEEALTLEIWLNEEDVPCKAEIVWQGRRVLSLDVLSFHIM